MRQFTLGFILLLLCGRWSVAGGQGGEATNSAQAPRPQATDHRPPQYEGRSLQEVIEELRAGGLQIVYSSSVVTPEMRVVKEPASRGVELLREIIEPHGLRVDQGRGARLLIVRDSKRDQTTTDQKPVMPSLLQEIVVTPSQLSLYATKPDPGQFLDREDVERIPHLADDLFRALGRLPGTASGDISARFNVRGGNSDETLVLLDGLEIDEPFHLQDFQSLFSIVDSQVVGGVDFMPGGFPSQYGDRMSAVIDLTSASAPSQQRTFAGISFVNTTFVSQGTFQSGEWLLAARRGYIDLVLDLVQPDIDIDPEYYDILGKFQWNLGAAQILSASVLAARDDFSFDEGAEVMTSQYGSEYLWLNLRSGWTDSISSQTVAYYGGSSRSRNGGIDDFGSFARVTDEISFEKLGIKQDWTASLSDRNVLKFGWDFREVQADYEYHSQSEVREPLRRALTLVPSREVDLEVSPEGNEAAFYLADRFRVGQRWTVEAGLRWDRQSYVEDGDEQISPRLNVVWNEGGRTTVRAAWGEFAQSQGINELDVRDEQTEFAPAENSRQALLSIARDLIAGALSARVDLYQKDFTDLRPRFENLFDPLELYPETEFDRVRITPERARARGAELLLEGRRSGLAWWLSYARSDAVDVIGGEDVPRSWNQENAVNFSVNFPAGAFWNFNLAANYHSGWPTTPIFGEITGMDGNTYNITPTLGRRNEANFPDYHRFDVRATRAVPISRGSLKFFLEIYNVLNRKNPCCAGEFLISLNEQEQSVVIEPQPDEVIGWIPSFGIAWEF